MQFKSAKVGGYQIFAITGVNTVSFAINGAGANTKGLLGFAVERHDPKENQKYYMLGYKVFRSVIPKPDRKTTVSTFDHPVQSFIWDDFTAKDGYKYEYIFHPLKGTPKNIDRSAKPIPIKIETEPLFSNNKHDIFFNRGVASSQAYVRKFDNKKPDQLPPAKREEALEWLSRKLDDALLKFIANAKKGDTLLCCFYEFRYKPAVEALKAAIKRKVNVRVIIDAKVNGRKDKTGKLVPSFPREENLAMIKKVGIPAKHIIRREAKPNNIQHNKFMVLKRGKNPVEVWTGSTNISEGGIFGQTNVGHWVRDKDVAKAFEAYWELLSGDPGPKKKDDRSTALKKNNAFRKQVVALTKVPDKWEKLPKGTTVVFSPRSGDKVLKMYAEMTDKADDLSCITLAFGVNKEFKALLKDNTAKDHLAFFLLEKQDKPNKKSKQPFIAINAKNNVYKAWGSFLRDSLYQWTKETNTRKLQLNQHVSYIHSKFSLMDPLSNDPIVVSGSANFSGPSTTANDENMLIIRGDQRVADIYFTEFNRLFFHYYFRSVQEVTLNDNDRADDDSLFLSEKGEWLKNYVKGKLRHKRVIAYSKMDGF